MNLADFWMYLPGEWSFHRSLSNHLEQSGVLKVETINPNLYQGYENGTYNQGYVQTFFRNYRFSWENNTFKILGENPKEGYVLLHALQDNRLIHTHQCNKDFYTFHLEEVTKKSWKSFITIVGPHKNLKIITVYQRKN